MSKEQEPVRTGFYIEKELLIRADEAIQETNARSRSEFISDALEFYTPPRSMISTASRTSLWVMASTVLLAGRPNRKFSGHTTMSHSHQRSGEKLPCQGNSPPPTESPCHRAFLDTGLEQVICFDGGIDCQEPSL